MTGADYRTSALVGLGLTFGFMLYPVQPHEWVTRVLIWILGAGTASALVEWQRASRIARLRKIAEDNKR